MLSQMPSEFKASRKRGRGLSVDGWFVPDPVVRFVSHLPKPIEAAPVRPLAWLYKYEHTTTAHTTY